MKNKEAVRILSKVAIIHNAPPFRADQETCIRVFASVKSGIMHYAGGLYPRPVKFLFQNQAGQGSEVHAHVIGIVHAKALLKAAQCDMSVYTDSEKAIEFIDSQKQLPETCGVSKRANKFLNENAVRVSLWRKR